MQNLKSLVKSWILLEATRFKRETGANAERWQEKLIRYEKAGGYFVHFSNIPKMGLFTRNKYGTPIGFYAYPLDREKMQNFAVDRPYALILKPKPEVRLLDLQSFSNQDLSVDIQKLIGLKYSKARVEKASAEAITQTPGGKLWNITRVLSGADKADAFLKKVGKDKETKLPLKGGGPTGAWTMLLRRLGYDGVVDEGDGIIHNAEPSQAVFFDTTKLELVEVIEKPADVSTKSKLFAKNLQKRDLSGQDLSGEDFQGANLQGANLQGANLEGAILEGANLQEANLQRANLQGANLQEANLQRANLQGANLQGANLYRANLQGANLYRAYLEGANLRGANLQEANLYRANPREANLQGANLEGAILEGANLEGANLEGAILEGANLQEANLEGADLSGANLQRAELRGANLYGADLSGANLYGADLQGANLYGANLQRANLQRANLHGANLEGANLVEANLQRADLLGTNLEGAVITDSTLLDKAKYNSQTKFPQNFDPEKRDMVKTD